MTEVSISTGTVDKFKAAQAAVSNQFVGRDPAITTIMAAMIARQHVYMLGPPGTGKSALGRSIASTLSADFWQYLFSRTTTPDEVFGPLDLNALKDGRYERITTGRLPCATVAFMDEIGKANSTVQNAMLTAINERTFDAGRGPECIPLRTVLAASNELPDPKESGAFLDRFAVKLFMDDSVSSRGDWDAVVTGQKAAEPVSAMLSLTDWDTATQEAEGINCDGARSALWKIKGDLEGREITHTVRRWKAIVSLCKAKAWLSGRNATTSSDASIAEHCLWRFPKEQEAVSDVVSDHCAGMVGDARRLAAGARKMMNELETTGNRDNWEECSRVVREVTTAIKQIRGFQDAECDAVGEALMSDIEPLKTEAMKKLGL